MSTATWVALVATVLLLIVCVWSFAKLIKSAQKNVEIKTVERRVAARQEEQGKLRNRQRRELLDSLRKRDSEK